MSDNGQQVPLIERLRRVPAIACVQWQTPCPGGYEIVGIPVGALCREAADRIAELERERDQYHDALIARHGGEPVALLAELDEARARIVELEAELAAERERREAAEAALRELVSVDDERDRIIMGRLYGKPHLPEHKALELDHRQRRLEAWRAARNHFARYEKEPT